MLQYLDELLEIVYGYILFVTDEDEFYYLFGYGSPSECSGK